MNPEPEAVNISQAARFLGLHRETVTAYIDRGIIPEEAVFVYPTLNGKKPIRRLDVVFLREFKESHRRGNGVRPQPVASS